MSPEQELADVTAEALKLNRAVTDAFGMPPTAQFTIQPTGIQFQHSGGWITWFAMHGWTTEQEEAVKGLCKHFPQRWVGSIPSRWEVEEVMKQ